MALLIYLLLIFLHGSKAIAGFGGDAPAGFPKPKQTTLFLFYCQSYSQDYLPTVIRFTIQRH